MIEIVSKPLERHPPVCQQQLRAKFSVGLREGVDDLHAQRLLARNPVIKGAFGNPGLRRNPRNADVFETRPMHRTQRGANKLRAGVAI
jgi:hypothetical protein